MKEKCEKILKELLEFCEEYKCNVNVVTVRDFDKDKVETIYLNTTTFDKNAKPNITGFKIENN